MTSTFTHSTPPRVEVKAVLDAPLAAVAGIAVRVVPGKPGEGEVGLLAAGGSDIGAVSGGPQRFRVSVDDYGLTVDLDAEKHAIAFQGGWWYRGEYHCGEHPDGTLVVHRVYNVAGAGSRWLVPLANRFFRDFETRTRARFTETMKALGDRLGCRVRVLPSE